jgi:hypothetical protein
VDRVYKGVKLVPSLLQLVLYLLEHQGQGCTPWRELLQELEKCLSTFLSAGETLLS